MFGKGAVCGFHQILKRLFSMLILSIIFLLQSSAPSPLSLPVISAQSRIVTTLLSLSLYFVTPQSLHSLLLSFSCYISQFNSQGNESDCPCSPCFGQNCSHQMSSEAPDDPTHSRPPSNERQWGAMSPGCPRFGTPRWPCITEVMRQSRGWALAGAKTWPGEAGRV